MLLLYCLSVAHTLASHCEVQEHIVSEMKYDNAANTESLSSIKVLTSLCYEVFVWKRTYAATATATNASR